MIKLNINEMELPVFDIIRATPILIPLNKNKHLIFEIPSAEKYFKFEAEYLSVIKTHLLLFANVNFLTVKEFSSKTMKGKMMKGLKMAMQDLGFKKDLNKIIREYFKSNFWLRNLHKKINPMQYAYLFLFIHCIVETVKSFFFGSGGKGGAEQKGDVGDFFYFFEKNFGKNRTQILAEPITYLMLLQDKWNQDQKDQAKAEKKVADALKKKGKKPAINIKKFRKGKR